MKIEQWGEVCAGGLVTMTIGAAGCLLQGSLAWLVPTCAGSLTALVAIWLGGHFLAKKWRVRR